MVALTMYRVTLDKGCFKCLMIHTNETGKKGCCVVHCNHSNLEVILLRNHSTKEFVVLANIQYALDSFLSHRDLCSVILEI